MDAQTDILKRGLEQAGLAVLGASSIANLHLRPRQITRSAAQKISGRLRQIETIVRRLILVLALRLQLEPTPQDTSPAPNATPAPPDLPDGVELTEFPRVAARRLNLLPARQTFDGLPFPDVSTRATGPVIPLKLIARIAALQRVIAAPDAHAVRLARTLRRLRDSGEPRPMVGPTESAYRLSPELGAIATLLPSQLNAALETWESSG